MGASLCACARVGVGGCERVSNVKPLFRTQFAESYRH